MTAGDQVSFESGGSVQINLADLVRSITVRVDAENKLYDDKSKQCKCDARKNDYRPELDFSDDINKQIVPGFGWTGPDGNEETDAAANPSRRKLSILPSANYGALLGAISRSGAQPVRSDAFLIGSSYVEVASKTGKLWFTVNDIWDDQNRSAPGFKNKFFVDNIGFFYAKVTVQPKGWKL